MNKLLKNTIYYSIGEVCPRIISFFLLPIYTNYLSPSDYGILSYTNTIILFLLVFGTMALNSYVLRYYFIYNNENDRRRLIGSIVSSIFFMNTLILCLAFIFLPRLIDSYHIQVPWEPYFKLAIIINFLDSFSIIPLVIFRVRQEASNFVRLNLCKAFLQVVLNIYFIVHLQVGLVGYYYSMLGTYIPFFFIYAFIIKKYGTLSLNISIIKEGFRFSLPLIPGSIAYLILSVSDRIILERNVSMSDLGLYNVAFTMALALNIVVQSGYRAIEPEIYKHYGQSDYNSFVQKIQTLYFIAIYVVGLGICLFSQEAFYFMTSSSFHEGYKLVPLLIIGVMLTGHNVIYGGIISAEKRTKVSGIITLIGGGCSILFNLIFIPIWGIYAAAISSSISFLIMNSLLYLAIHFPGKSVHREYLSIIIILLLSYLVFYLLQEISIIYIFIKLLLVLIYTLFCFRLFTIKFSNINNIFNLNKNSN